MKKSACIYFSKCYNSWAVLCALYRVGRKEYRMQGSAPLLSHLYHKPGLYWGTSQESGEIKITPETSGLWIGELQMPCKYKVCAGCSGGDTGLCTEPQRCPTWVVMFCLFWQCLLKHESCMKLFQQFLNVWEVTKSFFHSGLFAFGLCHFVFSQLEFRIV